MFLHTQATTMQFVSAVIVLLVYATIVQLSSSVQHQLVKAFLMQLATAIHFVLTKVRSMITTEKASTRPTKIM